MVAGLPRSGPGMSVQKQYGTCRTVREGVVPPPSPREETHRWFDNRAVIPDHHDTVPVRGLEDMYKQQQVATDVHRVDLPLPATRSYSSRAIGQIVRERKREEQQRALSFEMICDRTAQANLTDLFCDRTAQANLTDLFSHLWQGRPDRLYVKTMSCEFVLTENMEGATSCATARSRASALTVDGPRVSA